MGCGSSGNINSKFLDEFYLEAFAFTKKAQKGLDVENSNETQTTKALGTGNTIFQEEIMLHGDESGVIKPWMEGMLSPQYPLEENVIIKILLQ